MMWFLVFFLSITLFSSISADVIVLGDNDFHQALESQEIWFVEFYAPWCGFCQKLTPVWHELSTAQTDVKIAKIDCTKSKRLCGKEAYDISSYPTFKYIKHGTLHDYLGSRSKEAFMSFVKKIKGQAWTELTEEHEIEDLFPSATGSSIIPSSTDSSSSMDNGVVFLLTLHAPHQLLLDSSTTDSTTTDSTTTDSTGTTAREMIQTKECKQAMDGLNALETAFKEVAHTLHSTTSFAILRIDTSSTLLNPHHPDPHHPDPHPPLVVGAKLERLERNRPLKAMTHLPHIAYYLPTDQTDNPTTVIPTDISTNNPTDNLPIPSSLSSESGSESSTVSEPPSSLTDSLLSFVRSHNYAFMTALDAHNFRPLADLHKLMVIAVVEGPNPRDEVISISETLWESNKYHHKDKHGLIHALDIVASHYLPLLNHTTNATESLLFGYLPAKQWKKWLKQYGCQRAPALLLLGLDYREPGWVFKCFQMNKYLIEKDGDQGLNKGVDQSIDGDEDKEKIPDKNKNKKENKKEKKDKKDKKDRALEWSGAANALQRKLSRVVSKVLAGDMEYTNKVKIGYGFFFSLIEHVMSRFNAYYPWSMLLLVPVILIGILCIVPSSKIQPKRKRD